MFARSSIGYPSCFVIRVSVLQHNWVAQMKKNIYEENRNRWQLMCAKKCLEEERYRDRQEEDGGNDSLLKCKGFIVEDFTVKGTQKNNCEQPFHLTKGWISLLNRLFTKTICLTINGMCQLKCNNSSHISLLCHCNNARNKSFLFW